MSAVLTPAKMTPQEYLEWESLQPTKHEYIAGDIFAMTGVRLNHNRISGSAFAEFRSQLRGRPCGVFTTDVKLQVATAQAYFYPDVVITCDPRDLADGRAIDVNHPWFIAEVLSDGTAAFDRSKKFEYYRSIPSLTHYLLLETTRSYGELFQKTADGVWAFIPLGPEDSLVIGAPHAMRCPMASLYEGVSFEPTPGSTD